ncbi:hypothetical protein A2Z22_00080 [Candidatus Woesebacteria bacterium RBG_16_34_12]|uniref:DUF5666 domain-containing protein n=1 Tax=Candidatus Woesebacteria bacterium RBG_16_34_12 TaxID=1802480 RepID=A0A1F7X9W1_9BACT|nr:MAG: hypothetical protein A2Z22_00080 [Candidatus Woesebacteria bacterium RBG_16_34_12]
MNKNILITIIVALVVGVGAFFGGVQYQKSKKVSFTPGQFQNGIRPSGFPQRNGFQGGRPVSGEITSIEDNTITVKTQDGSSKIVIYSDSTKVNKTSEGLKEDLKVGEQVMVIGSEGTDGTVTAQNISIGGNFFREIPAGQPPDQNN